MNEAQLTNLSLPEHRLPLGLISNPLSGGNRKGLQPVRKLLADYPQVLHREVCTPEQVVDALKSFAAEGVKLVGLNGGDGTIQAALTTIFDLQPFAHLPVLALLRSGTTSMIANDVGLKKGRLQALKRLCRWAFRGEGRPEVIYRPVLRMQPGTGQKPYYGMFFGAGLIFQGIQFCHKELHSLGLGGELAPGLALIRMLLAVLNKNDTHFGPSRLSIALDHHAPRTRDCLVVLVSTLDRLFLGLRPYWGPGNGPLHYTAVEFRPKHLLRTLPYLMRGHNCPSGTQQNGYISEMVHEVRLDIDSGFTLDGELFAPDPLRGTVTVGCGGQVPFLRL